MNKYLLLGMSVIGVVLMFAVFTGNPMDDFDHTGIVHDVRATSSGYTFIMDSSGGDVFKCFYRDEVEELCHYGISGNFSSDNSIFFVSAAKCFDKI